MNVKIDEQNQNHSYISENWEALGACAWKEHLAHGRGALLIGGFDEPDDFIYLPLEVLVAHPLLKDYARFAEDYDPSREVVVIFLQQPPSVSAYKGGIPERGTPPQLYKRLKAVLQES
jgi:hypothetical protein